MNNKKIELLSPVGDFERLVAAINFGADAVYLGAKQFGMRAASANFDEEGLINAVNYAHQHNVKVYLTCNTLPTNQELADLPEFFKAVDNAKLDAIIITDIGVLAQAKKYLPNTEVHISTQAGIVNYLSATEFYNLGAKRVVLARELNFEDIAFIRANTPKDLELEAFVHGAMCMSFSGRCLLSSYMTDRDANRGKCSQPCRFGYYLVEEKRPNEFYRIYEDEKGSYILNAKDMCMIEYVDKLAQCGIDSFKIEGRAKSAYYVSVITNAYRLAIDKYTQNPLEYKTPDWLIDEVCKVSHRQYTTGFYLDTPSQYYQTGGYVRNYDVVGIVEGYQDGYLLCVQRNKFLKGETLEALEPKAQPFQIEVADLLDEKDVPIDMANKATMKFKLKFDRPLKVGTILRKDLGKEPA